MQDRAPIHRLQELFVPAAETRLPPDPAISWNSHGVMTYFWPSPCHRIKGLWVHVDEDEITLATALSHTHLGQTDWEVRNGEGDLLDRIVDAGIAKALGIFSRDIVFTRTCDPQGIENSSSGISSRERWNALEQQAWLIEHYGAGYTTRAWDWHGEVLSN